jgi:hypothetical protein
MKLIINGAPTLADELCSALANTVEENRKLKAELAELKKTNEPKKEV